MANLPVCPNCGSGGFVIHAQAQGPAKVFYDNTGEELEVFYDLLRFERSSTVRCEDCGKIRRDVEYDPYENQVVLRHKL